MEQKNRWTRMLALGLGAALLLSGCTSGDKESEATATPTPEATPTAPVESNGPTDWSKYNAYLSLADSIYDIEDVLSVYFDNVDYAEEFTVIGDYGALKDATSFYTSFTYAVENALDYADEAPSYPDADAAVQNLGRSPIAVMDVLEDLASYLRWDDYLEDDLAKGAELHAQLWAALETYDQYYGPFLAAINELADMTREEGLNELLEEGQMILYHSSTMLYAGQDIVGNIWDQVQAAVAENPDLAEAPALDMTELSPLFAQFQSSYDSLTEALNNEEERAKVESFNSVVGDSSLKLYTNQVNNCYSKMGALSQALLEGGDYLTACDNASEALSGFVGAYNGIN